MASQAARVTGLVLRTDTRSGFKVHNHQTGEGNAWSMTTVRVLVGGEDVCDVTFPADKAPLPSKGSAVDWLVQIRAGGKFLNVDYAGPWTAAHDEALV